MRSELRELEGQSFDVAIIGAGINGCSAAQHLAAAGYKVLLVDQNDFASGATSRSGRILHCGLRFLAPKKTVWEFFSAPGQLWMKIRTAKEMAEAQGELYTTIRPYLRPMDIALPIYAGQGYSGWHVDIGAMLVRWMNRGRSPINYRRWKGVKSPHPFVRHLTRPEAIRSVVAFDDQQFIWPERIALDACFNARDLGAVVRNYTRVVGLEKSGASAWRLQLSDMTGSATVEAAYVLNLAGIEIDAANRLVPGLHNIPPRVRAMKGVHILVRLPKEYRGHGIAGENSLGEHIFCLPWGEYHYIGPTETIYDGDPNEVTPDDEDISFLKREAQALLPGLPIMDARVELAWAGARPITFDPEHAHGKRLPFSIFHDMTDEGARNLLAVTWGIIVNHRATARRIVDEIRKRLSPSGTGCRIDYAPRSRPNLNPTSSKAELDAAVAHFIDVECATSAVDILCRRTMLFWDNVVTAMLLSRVVAAMSDKFGWSERRQAAEIDDFRSYVSRQHRVDALIDEI
ncbi:FAD-dependent oxidoreductase [Aureimonas populi]|uniref:FAD-dependent oxidoreductase n=1 Tax=Aureimonas populi TaxID=1701758 RepID=A0ABW5CLM6_9HYPH|nr:FAD-dependent oxidoreductase [Aureimonas populi]